MKVVGAIQLRDTGRPEWVYSKRNIKMDLIEHEYWLTEYLLPFVGKYEILRGNHVDPEIRPDAELIGKNKTMIEMDMHTEGYSFIAKRMEIHNKHNDRVLWICFSEERMQGLKKRASRPMFFTTIGSKEWIGSDDSRISVEKLLNTQELKDRR